MRSRPILAAATAGAVILVATTGQAEDRWVDDEAISPRMGARAGAGFGVGMLTYPRTANGSPALVGTGLNIEGSIGLGLGLEVGARLGFRLDDPGRGLRADEIARGFQAATFGTGLSSLANPELRLRWRAGRWRWLEVGGEERVVLPDPSDPNVTEVVGVWAAAHLAGVARADVDLDGVLSWQSLAVGEVLVPALGLPIRLWLNPTRRLFAGLVVTPRYFGPTAYTSSALEVTTGAVVGYRWKACDIDLGLYLIDVVNGGTDRSGAGLRVLCRMRPAR